MDPVQQMLSNQTAVSVIELREMQLMTYTRMDLENAKVTIAIITLCVCMRKG